MNEEISVYDDKYKFYMKDRSLHCLRYGEPWRDFIGDGAVLQLFLHAVELDELSKAANEWLGIYFELYSTGDAGRMLHPKMKQFREESKADAKLDSPKLQYLDICSWCIMKALNCLRGGNK